MWHIILKWNVSNTRLDHFNQISILFIDIYMYKFPLVIYLLMEYINLSWLDTQLTPVTYFWSTSYSWVPRKCVFNIMVAHTNDSWVPHRFHSCVIWDSQERDHCKLFGWKFSFFRWGLYKRLYKIQLRLIQDLANLAKNGANDYIFLSMYKFANLKKV